MICEATPSCSEFLKSIYSSSAMIDQCTGTPNGWQTPDSYKWKWRSIPDLDSAISVLGSAIGVIGFVWKHVA